MTGSSSSDVLGLGINPGDERGTGCRRDRRAYTPPVVTRFGKIGTLARFGGSSVVDSGTGGLGQNPRPGAPPG